MTKLLVSVRDADEARDALSVGVDLLDVKEPDQGSLGRAADDVITKELHLPKGRNIVFKMRSQPPRISMNLSVSRARERYWLPSISFFPRR